MTPLDTETLDMFSVQPASSADESGGPASVSASGTGAGVSAQTIAEPDKTDTKVSLGSTAPDKTDTKVSPGSTAPDKTETKDPTFLAKPIMEQDWGQDSECMPTSGHKRARVTTQDTLHVTSDEKGIVRLDGTLTASSRQLLQLGADPAVGLTFEGKLKAERLGKEIRIDDVRFLGQGTSPVFRSARKWPSVWLTHTDNTGYRVIRDKVLPMLRGLLPCHVPRSTDDFADRIVRMLLGEYTTDFTRTYTLDDPMERSRERLMIHLLDAQPSVLMHHFDHTAVCTSEEFWTSRLIEPVVRVLTGCPMTFDNMVSIVVHHLVQIDPLLVLGLPADQPLVVYGGNRLWEQQAFWTQEPDTLTLHVETSTVGTEAKGVNVPDEATSFDVNDPVGLLEMSRYIVERLRPRNAWATQLTMDRASGETDRYKTQRLPESALYGIDSRGRIAYLPHGEGGEITVILPPIHPALLLSARDQEWTWMDDPSRAVGLRSIMARDAGIEDPWNEIAASLYHDRPDHETLSGLYRLYLASKFQVQCMKGRGYVHNPGHMMQHMHDASKLPSGSSLFLDLVERARHPL